MYAAVDQLVLTEQFSVSETCRVLEVSRSGFWSWKREASSRRQQDDEELMPLIQEVFWHHRRRYGARRITQELHRRDIACGVARVARLMKTLGIKAIQPKSFTPKTTDSGHNLGYNANLLADRDPPTRINEVWVADITYIALRTRGFGYLALIMDLCSRRIIGWEYASTMTDELVLSALKRAINLRQPEAGVIHHSDRGGQYASRKYRGVLRRAEAQQSMSAAGNCYDNAFMESCFGTIKTELQLVDYADHTAAVHELSEYLRYYNLERRHSSLAYDTPIEFEQRMTKKPITPAMPK